MKIPVTNNEFREACVSMWTIISKTGCTKGEALVSMGVAFCDRPEDECYACQYVNDMEDDEEYEGNEKDRRGGDCSYCPVRWCSGPYQSCGDPGSPYRSWKYAKTHEQIRHAGGLILYVIKASWKIDKE